MKKLFLLLAISIFGLEASAVIAHLNHDVLGHNLGVGSNYSITVPAVGSNNLMVVSISWCCVATLPSLSDDKGNSWTQVGPTNADGAGDYLAVYYAIATTSGTTSVSVNSNSGGSPFITISYGEFSGVSIVSPYDTGVTALTGGPTADSGALTPSVSGELLFCTSSYDSNEVPTAGSGFTLMQQYGATNADAGIGAEYQIYNSTSPVHGILQYVGTGAMPAIMVAFKPAAGGAASVRHKVITY